MKIITSNRANNAATSAHQKKIPYTKQHIKSRWPYTFSSKHVPTPRIGRFISGNALDEEDNEYSRPDVPHSTHPHLKKEAAPHLFISGDASHYSTPYIKSFSMPYRNMDTSQGSTKPSRGFFDGIAAFFSPPRNPSAFQMDVRVTNTQLFSTSIASMYETFTQQITDIASSSKTSSDQIIVLNNYNTSTQGDIVYDVNINQNIKFFNSEKLTVTVIKTAVQTATNSILDTLTNSLSNLTNADIKNIQSTTTNNSLISSILGNSDTSKYDRIGQSTDVATNIQVQKSTMVQNVVKNIQCEQIRSDILSSLTQQINANSSNIALNNINFKLDIHQTIDLMQTIVKQIDIASKIFNAISSETVFKTDSSVTSQLKNEIKSDVKTVTNNEQVSSVFSTLLSPITTMGYGLSIAAGVCGLAIIYFLFKSSDTHVHMNSAQLDQMSGMNEDKTTEKPITSVNPEPLAKGGDQNESAGNFEYKKPGILKKKGVQFKDPIETEKFIPV